jgi:hypothetical protein
MAARDGMTDLIARLRVMIGDPMPGDPALAAFTDDELEAALDERRTDVSEGGLRGEPTTLAGRIQYLTFYAPRKAWESDAILTDGLGVVLAPATGGTDALNGRWTFEDSIYTPVYVTGRYYDLYGTASAVLETWAAKVALEFDFGTDQQQFDRTGKREGLLKVAREFARKARPPGSRPAWRSAAW